MRNYVGTLSAIYHYAMHSRRHWARVNPCDEIDLPGVEATDEVQYFEREEVAALIRAAGSGPYQALDRALYLAGERTGLRHGELIAWRWMDLDYSAMRVRVRWNYVLGEFGSPKSKRSSRSLPLDEELAGELERYRKATAARLGHEPADDALVFADPITGAPLSKAATTAASRRRSKPPAWTRTCGCTAYDTRSACGAPRPASRCERSRSGWGTATSPRRSATPTTRRALTSPRCWRGRSGTATAQGGWVSMGKLYSTRVRSSSATSGYSFANIASSSGGHGRRRSRRHSPRR